jgi:hypothetical protein
LVKKGGSGCLPAPSTLVKGMSLAAVNLNFESVFEATETTLSYRKKQFQKVNEIQNSISDVNK